MQASTGSMAPSTAAHAQALTDGDAIFRVAFADAPIGMLITAPDLEVLRVNRALCEMLGYSEEEILGADFWRFTHPDDLAPNQDLVRRALNGEFSSYELEKRYRHKDGHFIWGLLVGSLVRDERGAPRYFISQILDINARKAIDQEFAETHQRTSQVLERITDGFYALDPDWRFTYLNAEAERILGQPREQLLGRNVWEAFPAVVETPLYPTYQQAMAEGAPTSVEFYYPPFDGWYDVRAYASSDGLSVFFREVTERRRLTEELQASEAKFRTLVEQLPAAVYLLAGAGKGCTTYASPYLEVMTGYPPNEVLDADRWLAYLHPDDRDRAAAVDARSTATGEAFRLDYRFLRKDGAVVWVRNECVPLRDATGSIVAWQGVMMDITDRVEAGEVRGRLAALVESAEDAIFGSTLDGTITSWNRGAEKLYGYRAEEILGQSYAVLLPDDLDEPLREDRVATVQAGAAIEPFETVRRRRDGSTVEVAISLSPVRDREGAVIGLSSITRDVTERKRTEAALASALADAKAANSAKSYFLAMMSHELRTPLQAVLGYAEFLLTEPHATLTVEQRADLGYIQQGGQRMLTLINQLLDLSKIEAGRLELDQQMVELSAVVEQVRQDVAPQAMQKGLALRIDLPDEMPAVLGDRERLRQVVLNLVGNAVKFTEEGMVSVTVRSTPRAVAIEVRDTGCGIAPEALPHIFEAFRQVDSRLSRQHGGAGLGLAIAQKLAELMGGQITVESILGAGSTFALWLPIASPTPQTAAR
jgi:PAS domain S-box-containing protein